MWAVDLSDLDAAEQLALDAWDAFGGLDAVVHNAAIPEAHLRHDLTPPTSPDDERQLRLAGAHDARGAAQDARAGVRARSCGCRAWAGASRSRTSRPTTRRSTRCAASRRRCTSTSRARRRHEARDARPDRHRDLGHPGNEPALIDIEKVPAADCAAGIADAMAGDGFEYYVPPVYPGWHRRQGLAVAKVQHCDNYLAGWPTSPKGCASRARNDRSPRQQATLSLRDRGRRRASRASCSTTCAADG